MEREEKFTVDLDDEQVAERTTQLLSAMDAIDAAEAEWDAAKTAHKAKLSGLEANRERLRQVVRDHREERVVKILEQPDRELGIMRIIRSDTMDEIRTRPMTPDERQCELAVGSPQLSLIDGGKAPPPPPVAETSPAGDATAPSEAVLDAAEVAANDSLAAEQAMAEAEAAAGEPEPEEEAAAEDE